MLRWDNVSDKEDGVSDEEDGVSDEEENVSDEDDNTSDEEDGVSNEEDGVWDEEDGISDEEDGVSDEEENVSDEDDNTLDEEDNVSDEKRLGTKDINLVDRKQSSFEVQPLESDEIQKFLKFTLDQKPVLNEFTLPYDDMETTRTTAEAQAAWVSTLSQIDLESDRILNSLSKHMPPRTYATLCTHLCIGYYEANFILARFNMDYQRATRDCLAQWKTRTGGNMDELETILQDAEVGDLVIYIE